MKNTLKYLSFLALIFFTSCSTTSDLAEKSIVQKKAELYYGQGTSDLIKRNYSQALINLLQAKELAPDDSQIRNNLGMAYYFREQFELAEKEFLKAIDLDKKNSDAKVNLGTIYMEKNRLKEAKHLYEQVVADLIYTGQFRNYYNLAILSLKIGDRAQAFEYLSKSIKEREDYCQAHFKLGELYFEEYKFKLALSSFQESSKGTCVNEPAPHYQQALALISLNRFEEAKHKLKSIIDKFPKSRFSTMASIQLKKNTEEMYEQFKIKNFQTEVVKESKTIESPNF